MTHSPLSKKSQAQLTQYLQVYLERLKELRGSVSASSIARFDELCRYSSILIERKLLPELDSPNGLPLLVSVTGGGNTGKSTVFNGLAGVLASEVKTTGLTTKHPLIYGHQDWADILLDGRLFAQVKMLEDPALVQLRAEHPIHYLKLHRREDTRDLILIDTPPLDSIDTQATQMAEEVLAQVDLCIFILTIQKYKDQVLIDQLKAVLSRGLRVFLLINYVSDAMLYETLLEELEVHLGPLADRLYAGGHLPYAELPSPDRIFSGHLNDALKRFIQERPHTELKSELLHCYLDELLIQGDELKEEYQKQTEEREGISEDLIKYKRQAIKRYEDDYALTFPEMSEALRIQLEKTEFRRLFPSRVTNQLQKVHWSTFVSQGLGLIGGRLRQIFLKQLSLNTTNLDWEKVRQSRDEQDLSQCIQAAQLFRAAAEQGLRVRGDTSAVARIILQRSFTADQLQAFDEEVKVRFWAEDTLRTEIGSKVLTQAELMNQKESGIVLSFAAWIANSIKLLCGGVLAWLTGGFGFWDLIFFPMGIIIGAYLLAWILYQRLRLHSRAFRIARIKLFSTLLEEVQVTPLAKQVEQLASREGLNGLIDELSKLKSVLK